MYITLDCVYLLYIFLVRYSSVTPSTSGTMHNIVLYWIHLPMWVWKAISGLVWDILQILSDIFTGGWYIWVIYLGTSSFIQSLCKGGYWYLSIVKHVLLENPYDLIFYCMNFSNTSYSSVNGQFRWEMTHRRSRHRTSSSTAFYMTAKNFAVVLCYGSVVVVVVVIIVVVRL